MGTVEGVPRSEVVAASAEPTRPPEPDDRFPTYLERSEWTERERRHHHRVDTLIGEHRARSAQHLSHPVEDFLFTYYSFRPAQLRRWHPGAGVGLRDAADRAQWRFYRTASAPATHRAGSTATHSAKATGEGGTGSTGAGGAVGADTAAFLAARGTAVRFLFELLTSTQAATPHFGCFGLHEWAMVYQADDRRHLDWPLRLGRRGTDDVVRAHQLRCTHFDAFRFFTPPAASRNLLAPALDTRDRLEQPGCLHASMDLYKWAYRLVPVISSELVLDCFRFAREIRAVDMQASPYDLTELGYQPIAIETAAGKLEYVSAQRRFAAVGAGLRARLLADLSTAFPLLAAPAAESSLPG